MRLTSLLLAAAILSSATASADASGKYKYYPPTPLNCATGLADELMGCPPPTPEHREVFSPALGRYHEYIDKNGYLVKLYEGTGTWTQEKDGVVYTFVLTNGHPVLTNSASTHWW